MDLAKLKQTLAACAGWEGDKIAKDRERALDYYFCRPRGDEVAGRSQVVSGDVSAMTEAVLSQMLDAFDSDSIAEFEPLGPDDEDQAQLEADAVQYFVMSRNNGLLELAKAIKDALLIRNGVLKVWVDETEAVETRMFRGVTKDALGALPNGVTIEDFDEDAGTLRASGVRRRKKLVVEAVPLENFFYTASWHSHDVQDIPCAGERHCETRASLIARGFPKKKVAELPAFPSVWKPDSAARDPKKHREEDRAIDKSQDLIEWFELYVLVDRKGFSERRRIAFSHNEILEDVPVSIVPYPCGVAIINPHRFLGISLWDKLRQVQDVSTALQRALLDNVNTVTKNRVAYLDGKVNVDDVADGRTNNGIRVKATVGDVRSAVMPFNVPDLSVGILQNIEHQKSVRAEMGGAALQLATGEMQLNDRIGSQGLDRAYSVQEQLAAMMTKNIAVTLIRSLFFIAHATLRENFDTAVPVKRNGRWASPVPAEWPVRECVHIKVGMSPGERARKAGALMQIVQSQLVLADKGMDEVLVNIDGFYRALTDWGRVSDIQNPEQYLVDPSSDTAQKAMQSKRQAAEQQRQEQKNLMNQAIQLEQLRTAFDKYKADQETQFKYWAETLKAEIAEAQIAGKATVELVKAKHEPKANGSAAASKEPAAA